MSALPEYSDTVRADWVDYNRHMSEAYYVLVFGFATDHVMDVLGMDAAYRDRTGNSLFTVEAHVRYLLQAREGDGLRVRTQVVGSGAKKLHLAHEMYVGDNLVSTEELLGIHVDTARGSAAPFGESIANEIDRFTPTHKPPDWIGRTVHS